MNIGVIGGSGFIGSHVVDKLIEAGHEVTVLDIMSPHRDDVRHVYIDITDISNTTVALTGNYDTVYHLAAMANVNDVQNNPIEATKINILGTANALEAARRNNIGRFILASTVWIYEMVEGEKMNEHLPLMPSMTKHVYTASKVAAELYCHAYQKLYGQEFTILRYGIPYGPRARGATVIAAFVKKAFNHEPLTIEGDGSQCRNFIYVEDLAEGNVAALNAVARNQTYNLEGDQPISIKEVAELVKKLLGDVAIEYKEARPGDYIGKIITTLKTKNELGWKPHINFEEGLRKYIAWYKNIDGDA
ncbi:NAD-dependent epimerase/dehydratase family protein [Chloroflexota bacterium]